MRTLIYTRVSTSEQVEKYGLDSQLRACKDYAAAHGMEIVAILSDDISGTTKIADRPQGGQIYEYVDNGKLDAVLLPTMDRTARDEEVLEYLLFKNYLHDNGIELHYADSGLDQYTMEDNLVGYIKANMASAERNKIMKRTMEGKRSKALQNKMVMTGFPPYGYYREGKRETAQLIINEPEAQVVRQIFNWYVSNNGDGRPLSLREITKRLISTGEPTPHYRKGPAQYWTPSTVNNILNNETYAGIAYYGKSRVVKVKGKKLKIKTPPEEWIKIEIPQLAIIDHKIFDLAQERGERNKQLAKRNRKREYLLAGFFRCGTCGATMSGGPAGGRKHRHYMYRCVTFWTRPGQQICMTGNRVVPMKRADERVWKWVENILVDAENLEIGLRRMVEMRKNETGPKRQRLNMVEDLITKAERKIERLIRTLEDEEDEYLITELRSSLKTASKMRDSLVNERDTLSYEVEEQEITPEKIDLVKQRAAEIRYKLIDPTYAQKRIVLDMVRLECVYRVDENGNRWIDAKCDLLPEGVLIELPLSSIAS